MKRSMLTLTLFAAFALLAPAATFAEDQADQSGAAAGAAAGADQSGAGAGADAGAADAGAAAAGQSDDQAQPAAGQQRGQQGRGAEAQDMDRMFLEAAARGNLFEIQSGQLAQRQAQDENVKRIAQELVRDHQQAQQKLQQVAQSMQAELPSDIGPVHQAMLQELQKKPQGKMFDRAFLYGQIGGHVKTSLKYRDAAQECQNAQLKQYASQTLPKIRQHLQHMQEAAQYDEAQTAGAREPGSVQPAGNRDETGSDPANQPGTGTGSDAGGAGAGGAGTGDAGGAGAGGAGAGGAAEGASDGAGAGRAQ